MKPLSNDHIDERDDLMRKKAWFLCVLLVSLLFTGCTAKTNELEKSDPSGTLNAADPQQDPAVSEPNEQAMTVDDSAERLLLALKEATEVDSERLETQFFRYYQAHNYELAMLPAFEKGHLPSWDELTLFVLLNNDDWLIVDYTQARALTTKAFSKTVTRFFGTAEYQDESSKYLTLKDDVYLAVPGDTMRSGFFRLKELSVADGEYTASFDAFYFADEDYTTEYEKATQNQKAVRDQAGIKDQLQPPQFADAMLEILSKEEYATVLDVSETVTITFSLSGDSKYPLTYTSCRVQQSNC